MARKDKIVFKASDQSFHIGKKVVSPESKKFLETAFIYFCGRVALGESAASIFPSDSPTLPNLSDILEFKETDLKWEDMYSEALKVRATMLSEKMVALQAKMENETEPEMVEKMKMEFLTLEKAVKSQEAYSSQNSVKVIFNDVVSDIVGDLWDHNDDLSSE